MKNKRLSALLIVFVMIFSMFLSSSGIALANGMEGEGTEESPYLIRTVEDLSKLNQSRPLYYKLMNDLDLENELRSPLIVFTGILDGNNKTIYNVNVKSISYGGLFSKLENAEVRDLHINGVNVSSTAGMVGALCGFAVKSKITGCSSTNGTISTNLHWVGGLVGYATLTDIYQCYSTCDVIAKKQAAGGLIGYGYGSTATQCFATGDVKAVDSLGGLVGGVDTNQGGFVLQDCYSTGTVTGTGTSKDAKLFAGLMSRTPTTVTNCYTANTINARYKSGLIGDGTVVNSFFNQELSGVTAPATQARTTDQLYQQSNYVGWDFENVWIIDDGNDYPKLRFAIVND